MSKTQKYELERDSRVMCYLPGGESIGGMVGIPIELCLDEINDDYFAEIKDLIAQVADVKNAVDENGITGISGDFRACVEIGPKDARPKELTTIFESVEFQVVPAAILDLHTKLKQAIRVSEGRDPNPPKFTDISQINVADIS